MELFTDDMSFSTVFLLFEEESIKVGDDKSTCPVYHVDKVDAVSLLRDRISSETIEESRTSSCWETESESEHKIIKCIDSSISAVTSSAKCMSSESHDDRATSNSGDTETESDDESATDPGNQNGMLVEQIPREQTELTRMNLVEIAKDPEEDEVTQWFAGIAAVIVEWWQNHTKDGRPTSNHVDFGVGSPINLLMILALLPERYQDFILIEAECRSPSGDGENLSWLHEQTTDVLVRLSTDPDPASTLFGQGLASMIRENVDETWRTFTGRSWLEDQLHLWSSDELELDLYRFPPETEKIVFLFNPTEAHWTVVEVSLSDEAWTYILYNSLCQGKRGPTWRACEEQLPLLEQLICRASGFPEPETREFVLGPSAQQANPYDCGPIAIYNAVEILEGRQPSTEVDAEGLRLRYLQLICGALYALDQGLELPEFAAYMRRVCLDNLTEKSEH